MGEATAEVVSAGSAFAVWKAPGVFGTMIWGPHREGEEQRFYRGVEDVLASFTGSTFDYLADTRLTRLGDYDWDSVSRGFRWMQTHGATLAERTARCVVLAPNTPFGWAAAGSYRALGLRFPTTVCTTLSEAVALLGRRALEPWLSALPAQIRSRASELARLRALLERDPTLTLPAAARAFGLGERSLQRALDAEGTSFRGEQARARRVQTNG